MLTSLLLSLTRLLLRMTDRLLNRKGLLLVLPTQLLKLTGLLLMHPFAFAWSSTAIALLADVIAFLSERLLELPFHFA